MDIKLKNIKYSRGTKIIAAVIIWMCFMSAFGSGLFLLYNERKITSDSYFETDQFRDEFSRLVHNVVELNIKLKSEETIKASVEEANIISDNLNRLQIIKDRLSSTVNFAYYIKNKQTGETVATNITDGDPAFFIQKQKNYVFFSKWQGNSYNTLQDDIMQMLSGTPYEAYGAVIEPLKTGDVFYDGFASYSKIKTMSTNVIVLLVISTLLMITAFIYLVCVIGRREKGGEIVLSFVDKIYTDVYSLFVFIAAVISIYGVADIIHGNQIQSLIFISIVLGIDVFIGLSYVLSMIRQIKNKQILRNTLIFRILNVLKSLAKLYFSGKVFKVWTLFLLIVYGVVNGILFTIASHGGASRFLISGFLLIAFNIATIYFAAKSLLSLTQIMGAAKEISMGNLDYPFDNSKISAAFSDFAGDIQSIQGGLKKAVTEAVRGERMKTDLITNVSHDLKTPLTSIINYVDLLKKEDLNNENAYKYVCILEEKSARLKKLIEDLVEASKASSGNLTIKAEKVDLHELVMQACGEYEEKIKKAALDIRIDSADKKTLVFADGKHMWRIVENLLSNVLKYSMPNSRVYINVAKKDLYGSLTIKNMSAFPLNISPEQLTERFVRGDASRATEGSGLGLSIAQSLTNIQGGRFSIDIDGDLFKVILEIPLWLENNICTKAYPCDTINLNLNFQSGMEDL